MIKLFQKSETEKYIIIKILFIKISFKKKNKPPKSDIDAIVWWIPFKNLRNKVRELYINNCNAINELTIINNNLNNQLDDIKNELKIIKDDINNIRDDINLSNYKINSLFQQGYSNIIETKKYKIKYKKLKVAFIVIWHSQFTMNKLYEMMIDSEYFEPYIICLKSKHNTEYHNNIYEEAFGYLNTKYKNVRKSYINGEYIDYSDDMDIAFFPMIHDYLFDKFYSPPYLYSKNVIMYYACYGYNISFSSSSEYPYGIMRGKFFFLMYKTFMDTQYSYNEYSNASKFSNKNMICTGYPKFDNIKDIKKDILKRKLIILAPHQALHHIDFCSSFLKYSEIYRDLPKLYPNIDFVFRPHPLLKHVLEGYWNKEEIEKYYKIMNDYDNCYLDESAEYYDIFINSDAMIHDCGSFLVEYLMLNKPALYMLDDKEKHLRYFNQLGKDCIENCYRALEEKDIFDFIDNVVLKGNDFMKDTRTDFIEKNLKVNHFKVNEYILDDIKKDLGIL